MWIFWEKHISVNRNPRKLKLLHQGCRIQGSWRGYSFTLPSVFTSPITLTLKRLGGGHRMPPLVVYRTPFQARLTLILLGGRNLPGFFSENFFAKSGRFRYRLMKK